MRILKYLLYGGLYLSFWGLIFGGVYLVILKSTASCFDNQQNQNETGVDCGGSCVPCDIKALVSLSFSQSLVFENNGLVSLLTEVRNPNLNYGSDFFEYKINFYDDQNNLVESKIQTSFIYAGETKELIEAGLRIGTRPVTRAEIILEDINWKPLVEWQTPILETSNIQFAIEGSAVVVTGTIRNPSNFRIAKIIVNAVLMDRFSRQLGVSKTELENLSPLQKTNFKIFIPINLLLQERINLEATQVTVKARR